MAHYRMVTGQRHGPLQNGDGAMASGKRKESGSGIEPRHLPAVCLSVCLPSVRPSVCLSVCLPSVRLSVCLSVCRPSLSVCLPSASVCLAVYLPACLPFVCLPAVVSLPFVCLTCVCLCIVSPLARPQRLSTKEDKPGSGCKR